MSNCDSICWASLLLCNFLCDFFFACTTDFEIKLAVIVILFSDVSTAHLYNVPATVAHY